MVPLGHLFGLPQEVLHLRGVVAMMRDEVTQSELLDWDTKGLMDSKDHLTASTDGRLAEVKKCCWCCNGTVKCLRCAHVRAGIPCSLCLPGDIENCHNWLPPATCSPTTMLCAYSLCTPAI